MKYDELEIDMIVRDRWGNVKYDTNKYADSC